MAVLLVKDGVQPHNLRIAAAGANVAHRMGILLRLTAGLDGGHGAQSLHYALRALDFGTKEFALPIKRQLVRELQKELGTDYDVLLENEGTDNEHVHAEFDPRK